MVMRTVRITTPAVGNNIDQPETSTPLSWSFMDQAFGVLLAFIMRKVAILGDGQSGLQLALGLPQNQYEVTVVSNRMPEQILSGRVRKLQQEIVGRAY
jgi:hypothetical protein